MRVCDVCVRVCAGTRRVGVCLCVNVCLCLCMFVGGVSVSLASVSLELLLPLDQLKLLHHHRGKPNIDQKLSFLARPGLGII